MRLAIRLVIALAALAAAGCGGVAQKRALQQDITAQITTRLPALQACYKTALERDKTIKGPMTLAFTIARDSVDFSAVQVANTQVTDDSLKQCVVEKTQGMKLTKPAFRPVEATYPLNFAPL